MAVVVNSFNSVMCQLSVFVVSGANLNHHKSNFQRPVPEHNLVIPFTLYIPRRHSPFANMSQGRFSLGDTCDSSVLHSVSRCFPRGYSLSPFRKSLLFIDWCSLYVVSLCAVFILFCFFVYTFVYFLLLKFIFVNLKNFSYKSKTIGKYL